jgi:guanosine-3',5'-bis(diphosphate) 3'-pyrophosphohydrolase
LDPILERILSFASDAHANQQRKFTGEKFINHPIRVMNICKDYTENLSILAAALLHDVLEDTPVTENELKKFLDKTMSNEDAVKTIKLVVDLTDVYNKEDFPGLNRKKRKNKEAERLEKSDPDAQTVKYADIIDNATDITRKHIDFAPKFLSEAQYLLNKLDKGHPELYQRAQNTVRDCFIILKEKTKREKKRKD